MSSISASVSKNSVSLQPLAEQNPPRSVVLEREEQSIASAQRIFENHHAMASYAANRPAWVSPLRDYNVEPILPSLTKEDALEILEDEPPYSVAWGKAPEGPDSRHVLYYCDGNKKLQNEIFDTNKDFSSFLIMGSDGNQTGTLHRTLEGFLNYVLYKNSKPEMSQRVIEQRNPSGMSLQVSGPNVLPLSPISVAPAPPQKIPDEEDLPPPAFDALNHPPAYEAPFSGAPPLSSSCGPSAPPAKVSGSVLNPEQLAVVFHNEIVDRDMDKMLASLQNPHLNETNDQVGVLSLPPLGTAPRGAWLYYTPIRFDFTLNKTNYHCYILYNPVKKEAVLAFTENSTVKVTTPKVAISTMAEQESYLKTPQAVGQFLAGHPRILKELIHEMIAQQVPVPKTEALPPVTASDEDSPRPSAPARSTSVAAPARTLSITRLDESKSPSLAAAAAKPAAPEAIPAWKLVFVNQRAFTQNLTLEQATALLQGKPAYSAILSTYPGTHPDRGIYLLYYLNAQQEVKSKTLTGCKEGAKIGFQLAVYSSLLSNLAKVPRSKPAFVLEPTAKGFNDFLGELYETNKEFFDEEASL